MINWEIVGLSLFFNVFKFCGSGDMVGDCNRNDALEGGNDMATSLVLGYNYAMWKF